MKSMKLWKTIVHVGNAADHLRQISACEPAVQWAIEYALLCNPPVLWRTTPIIKYSRPTCYLGMPGLGRASFLQVARQAMASRREEGANCLT